MKMTPYRANAIYVLDNSEDRLLEMSKQELTGSQVELR